MNLVLALFLSIAASASAGCVPCEANGTAICTKGWQTSLYENGECVFDSTVDFKKDVFVTGSVFSFGLCLTVTSQVGESCFENMAGQVAARLAGAGPTTSVIGGCESHMLHSPCGIGEAKYTGYTSLSKVADCAVIDILYADAMEECLRHDADGRFWAAVGYMMMVIIIGLGVSCGLIAFCAAISFQ